MCTTITEFVLSKTSKSTREHTRPIELKCRLDKRKGQHHNECKE